PPGPASSVSTQDKPTPPPQDKPAAETSTTTPPSKQADNPQPATSNKPDAKNQAQSDTLSGSQPQTISPSPANTTESLPPADNVSAQEEPQQTLATAEETVNLETQEDTTAAPASLPENSPSTPEGPEKVDRVVAAYSLTLSTPLGRQDSLLTLSARTLQRTHVSILSDGRKVFEDILSSGAEQSWNARNRFRIEVDDARALSLFLQGEPLQPIGKPGRKLRLFISRASIWVEEIEPIAPGTKP
ncbi:MAG: DUF4115 domain-containing protein, partial [bacterium]|nr:DUF4115 domain-containing protein [bacterium]